MEDSRSSGRACTRTGAGTARVRGDDAHHGASPGHHGRRAGRGTSGVRRCGRGRRRVPVARPPARRIGDGGRGGGGGGGHGPRPQARGVARVLRPPVALRPHQAGRRVGAQLPGDGPDRRADPVDERGVDTGPSRPSPAVEPLQRPRHAPRLQLAGVGVQPSHPRVLCRSPATGVHRPGRGDAVAGRRRHVRVRARPSPGGDGVRHGGGGLRAQRRLHGIPRMADRHRHGVGRVGVRGRHPRRAGPAAAQVTSLLGPGGGGLGLRRAARRPPAARAGSRRLHSRGRGPPCPAECRCPLRAAASRRSRGGDGARGGAGRAAAAPGDAAHRRIGLRPRRRGRPPHCRPTTSSTS